MQAASRLSQPRSSSNWSILCKATNVMHCSGTIAGSMFSSTIAGPMVSGTIAGSMRLKLGDDLIVRLHGHRLGGHASVVSPCRCRRSQSASRQALSETVDDWRHSASRLRGASMRFTVHSEVPGRAELIDRRRSSCACDVCRYNRRFDVPRYNRRFDGLRHNRRPRRYLASWGLRRGRSCPASCLRPARGALGLRQRTRGPGVALAVQPLP